MKKVVKKFGRERKKGVPLQHFRRWKGADKDLGKAGEIKLIDKTEKKQV